MSAGINAYSNCSKDESRADLTPFDPCLPPEDWPPPRSCDKVPLIGGVIAPMLRRFRAHKKVFFILLLLLLVIGLVSINTIASALLPLFPMPSIPDDSALVVSDRLLSLLRAAIVNLGNLYSAGVVWFLIWFQWKYSDSNHFQERFIGKATVSFGTLCLTLAIGLDALLIGGLKGTRAVLFFSLYQIGWVFLIAGLLNFNRIRSFISSRWIGITALTGVLIWWFIGTWMEAESMSNKLYIWTAILSVSYALICFALLSPSLQIRLSALAGLLLLQGFLWGTGMGQGLIIKILMDARLRFPVQTLKFLTWVTVVIWITGLMKRYGERWLRLNHIA